MFRKKIFLIILLIALLFAVGSVNAAKYSVTNSTEPDTISKMISGEIPIKDGKFIRNGDIIDFQSGDYTNLRLTINNKITLTSTSNGKNKVNFIGNGEGTSINIKSNNVKVYGLSIKNYENAIYAKTKNSYFYNLNCNNNYMGIYIVGSKNKIFNNKLTSTQIILSGKKNKIYSNVGTSNINSNGYKNILKKNILKKASITVSGKRNIVFFNKVSNSDLGIGIYGQKNKVYYNKLYKTYTALLIEKKKNYVYKNIVSKAGTGIVADGGKHSLTNNKISNCKYGIVYQFKSVILKNNIFKNNKKNSWYNPIVYPE